MALSEDPSSLLLLLLLLLLVLLPSVSLALEVLFFLPALVWRLPRGFVVSTVRYSSLPEEVASVLEVLSASSSSSSRRLWWLWTSPHDPTACWNFMHPVAKNPAASCVCVLPRSAGLALRRGDTLNQPDLFHR